MGKAKVSRDDFDTVSKQKYYKMIEAWGGWPLFQELLSALDKIGSQPLNPDFDILDQKPEIPRWGRSGHFRERWPQMVGVERVRVCSLAPR